jgi:alpha-D-ribose 1-methylphosphonate 5-triphosphate diphosphatase PhnM
MDGEELDLAAAVEMYTAAPARHLGLGEPLAVGSPADLVVSRGTEVAAVYRRGRRLDLRPAPWPG